ncbi:MAG: asparagine synthase-related protein, partial [Balneolales bacterium]|nr:asparagine synthase-related protein [Balneolales bacterium]
MSSFIGIWGKNDSLKSSIQDLIPEPDFYLNNNSVCIWLDGYHLTNHVHYNETTRTGWVVSGIGISSGEEPKTLIKEDWEYLLHSNSDLHSSINGHFAIARWSTDTLELTTDQVGMRNIFMHQTGEYILFSTRLDWIIKLVPQVSIDWKLFGSTWLGINPFSSHCFITGIDRLAQGGKAIITSNKVLFSNKRWTPSSIQSTSESVEQTLASLCLAAHRSFGTLSLGLSGGLDSRVLYALLIDSGIEPLSVYTFLEHGHPDEKMAAQLSEMYDLKHHSLPIKSPPVDEIRNQTSEISIRSLLMASIFQLPAFNEYAAIGDKNWITLDGAFGEIGRRRYLRGLELRGKKYLLDRNIPGLIPFFYAPKADIFLLEIETEMQAGFRQEFEEEVFHMPIPDKKDTGNWLDLFSIRTRGQNLYGLT